MIKLSLMVWQRKRFTIAKISWEAKNCICNKAKPKISKSARKSTSFYTEQEKKASMVPSTHWGLAHQRNCKSPLLFSSSGMPKVQKIIQPNQFSSLNENTLDRTSGSNSSVKFQEMPTTIKKYLSYLFICKKNCRASTIHFQFLHEKPPEIHFNSIKNISWKIN